VQPAGQFRNELALGDLPTNRIHPLSLSTARPVTVAAFGAGGTLLAVVIQREILVFRLACGSKGAVPLSKEPAWRLTGHTNWPIRALAFTPDGRTLLSGGRDRTVRLWDLGTGRQMPPHDWKQGSVYSLAVSADGMLAAVGGSLGRCVLWDLDF
jgi:hypothetical protein